MTILDRIIFHYHRPKLNILKTLIFNFKTLPVSLALKLPIFLYGKIDFYFLRGTIEFHNCEVKRGMVKMGNNIEYLGSVKGSSLIILYSNSKIIFEGTCRISSDFFIRTGEDAVLRIGNDTFFGSGIKLVCIDKITVGASTQFAFNCQILDSDFHYIHNLQTNEVRPREKEVFIGAFNWVGNNTSISKGTITENFTIIASNSLLNKNYKDTYQSYDVLAGQPARRVSTANKRIFPLKMEADLVTYFKENKQNKEFNLNCNKILKAIIEEND